MTTYRSHYFHVVWSTKDRENYITPEIKPRLYSYIGGIVKNHKQVLISIGGTENHLHLLIRFANLDKYSSLIRDIKAKSTIWVHENFSNHYYFQWQMGYGSFSVSHSIVDKIKMYIQNQEEHHKKISFDNEFIKILEKHEVEIYRNSPFDS